MGQYFKAVNIDKREFVCPWCIGGLAKLWEWSASPQGAIFTLLLRKSDHSGGGDYYCYERGYDEGSPAHPAKDEIAGRWAGDRVVLVGDYDSSKLWDKSEEFRNISKPLVDTWNKYIELKDLKFEYRPCSSHQ